MKNDRNMVIEVPKVKYPGWYTGDNGLSEAQERMAVQAPVPAVKTMDRDTMIRTTIDFDKQLETSSNQFKQMALAVCNANVIQRTPTTDYMLDYHGKKLKGYERPHVTPIRAQDVAQGVPALQQHVSDALVAAWRAFVAHMGGMLNQLVADSQVGVINWFSNDACSYNFFHNKYVESVKNETVYYTHTVHGGLHTEETKIRKTTKIWSYTSRYEHDLVDAKEYPLDAGCVRIPRRLLPVWTGIPKILRPHARIVSGNQIYQGVFPSIGLVASDAKENVKVKEWVDPPPAETQVWRPDPAIVLGHFVLAAWDASEV